MPASMVASFLIYIVTAFFTMGDALSSFSKVTNDNLIKYMFGGAITLNAFFFYYVEAFTETNDDINRMLQKALILEWYVRVINQILVLSLWFALSHGWFYFMIDMICIYSLFFIWDLLTHRYFVKNTKTAIIKYLDFAGFIATCLLIWVGFLIDDPDSPHDRIIWILGFSVLIYLAVVVFGISLLRFNPFSYINRTTVR